jgi:TolB-like protein
VTSTSCAATLPHHLARIVRLCLEKEPSRRYQSALDVRNELADLKQERSTDISQARTRDAASGEPRRPLRWWPIAGGMLVVLLAASGWWLSSREAPPEAPAPQSVAEVPRIVVLPFENLGPAEDEYFADGVSEEISSRLASFSGLGVISRTSAMRYKTERPPLKQVGADLGVSYVLAGTVRWARTPEGAGRVRITPRLTRVSDDLSLWAPSYEREIEDIFRIQSEIAAEVITQLGATFSEAERSEAAAQPTDSFEAYQAYLRAMEQARYPWASDDMADVVVQLFERAVELDPDFVLAWPNWPDFTLRGTGSAWTTPRIG